jgi:hypothetical protein
MTLFYSHEAGTGSLQYVFRLAFGVGMAVCLVLGVAAIRRGNVEEHRAWILRAYALAAGAGTQVFTQAFAEAVGGDGDLSSGLALGAGWVINLAVVEYEIGRRKAAPSRPARIMVGS